jgi:hypothetical protein
MSEFYDYNSTIEHEEDVDNSPERQRPLSEIFQNDLFDLLFETYNELKKYCDQYCPGVMNEIDYMDFAKFIYNKNLENST